MHGSGLLKWADGKQYEGQFVNDKRQGLGVFKWKDGRIYNGEWLDGKQHGRGTFMKVDGTKKVGIWENGRNIQWLEENKATAGYNKLDQMPREA